MAITKHYPKYNNKFSRVVRPPEEKDIKDQKYHGDVQTTKIYPVCTRRALSKKCGKSKQDLNSEKKLGLFEQPRNKITVGPINYHIMAPMFK